MISTADHVSSIVSDGSGDTTMSTSASSSSSLSTPSPMFVSDRMKEAKQLYESGKQLLAEQKDVAGAASCFERSVKIQEIELGKYHFDTVKTYHRLGRAQWLSQQPVLALLSWKRSVRLSINHATTVLEKEQQLDSMFSDRDSDDGSSNSDGDGGPSCLIDIDNDDIPSHVLLWKDALRFIRRHPMNIYLSNSNESEQEGVEAVPSKDILQDSLKAIWESLSAEQMANTLFKQKKYSKALVQYEKALQLEQDAIKKMSAISSSSKSSTRSSAKVRDIMTLDEADITCKIAMLYRLGKKDYESSLEYYVLAHEMYHTSLGKDHPATRGALANVRGVCQDDNAAELSKKKRKGKDKKKSKSLPWRFQNKNKKDGLPQQQ